MIYGCSQPRELWFIDFNHVCELVFSIHAYTLVYMYLHVRTDKNLIQYKLAYTNILCTSIYIIYMYIRM